MVETNEVTLTPQEQEYFTSRGESPLLQEDLTTIGYNEAHDEALESAVIEKEAGQRRLVPHGALHAEREEHKKTKALLAQLRAEQARQVQENHATNGQSITSSTVVPDPTQDFLGFTRWQAEEIGRIKQEMAAREQRESEAALQARAEDALWTAWHSSYETGKSEMPDLDEALAYLSQTREQQLLALGSVDARMKNPAMRAQQMRDELRDLVASSMQAGEDPASMIYQLARGFGYGTGGVATRFERLGEAQRAARTLAASSGRDAGNPLLLETVANLGEEDFIRWYEDNSRTFRKMFGG